MKIRFIGALGSVTGSCTLFTYQRRYYLVDCGATQGGDVTNGTDKALPFKASGLRGVFLTHAHLDHCGMLPELVRQGFKGDIYCTRATADLTRLALLDAADQSGSQFNAADVNGLRFECLDDSPGHEFGKKRAIAPDLAVSMFRTAHILGSVGFEFSFRGWSRQNPGRNRSIVFSGDLGCNTPGNCYQSILDARQAPNSDYEYLVCESTYGRKVRDPRFACHEQRFESLARLVSEAKAHGPGATIVMPVFTLHRLQELVLDLHSVLETQSESRDRATDVPVEMVIDSPLAGKYGEVYGRELLRLQANGTPAYRSPELAKRLKAEGEQLELLLDVLFGKWPGGAEFDHCRLVFGKPDDGEPAGLRIILAGAGMCNGGRVMAHLKRLLVSKNTTVAITGYQGFDTPGAQLMKRVANPGAPINGDAWNLINDDIKARVVDLSGFYSGHADAEGLLDFIFQPAQGATNSSLKRVFLVHGDDLDRAALKAEIENKNHSQPIGGRRVEKVEMPNLDGRWFDLVTEKWVWEFHKTVDTANEAATTGFGRLQKIEELLTIFCKSNSNSKELDSMITNLNLAKASLSSARALQI